MKSELKPIELNKEFPCLMEYRLQGETLVGTYLVNKLDNTDGHTGNYSVCLVKPADCNSKLGETYFKESLNEKEWFFLPKGTVVTLTN